MKDLITFLTHSSNETEDIGKQIGQLVESGDVLCLTGDLGAGKTTLVKGIAKQYTGISGLEVTSPTFTYLNIYSGLQNLYHFDLYRLSSPEEFIQAGFLEFLSMKGICCIEWPDRLPTNLSLKTISIHIEYVSFEQRKITLQRNHAS
ncbi:MAG: tRNA (adenosine(37)-N6)-threonylcarbamoyltransferase complex ATPase subunit type 1 TsaE [Verrucomicrobia bacterium]|nr:tRNA (adenosine(37)-N6)-threonylcarbamoyltransferase complex ATPase subunit type 1 TsaE [Verrucomicrobiota bacterium]